MSARRRRPMLVLERVTKSYGTGEVAVQALRGIDLVLERGDFVAIMSASAAGGSSAS